MQPHNSPHPWVQVPLLFPIVPYYSLLLPTIPYYSLFILIAFIGSPSIPVPNNPPEWWWDFLDLTVATNCAVEVEHFHLSHEL
jgi:hypothetical protein